MPQLRAQSQYCKKSWTPQLRDQTLCFSAWDRCFSAAATKGWAWCKHNPELVECAAALRDLKLLVGSGDLDFTKGKYLEKLTFWQCVTSCEHGQPKGWQPHFEPTVAKNSISTHCNSMANGKNTFQHSVTNLGDHNSVAKPMLLYTGFATKTLPTVLLCPRNIPKLQSCMGLVVISLNLSISYYCSFVFWESGCGLLSIGKQSIGKLYRMSGHTLLQKARTFGLGPPPRPPPPIRSISIFNIRCHLT